MRVFITGITGSLGTAIAHLHHDRGDKVHGCARDEDRGLRWHREHPGMGHLILADCATIGDRMTRAGRLLPTMDRLYHCAALKHVDACEADPVEAFTQNVIATARVAGACRVAGVPVVFASTDKAYQPANVYGATKLIAERIVLGEGGAVVRFGNLIGSSGSVFRLWAEAVERGEPIRLTDPEMTRYFIPVREAARFMADQAVTGEIAIPFDMRAVRMGDVAAAIGGRVEVIGTRPGETMHQELADRVSSETAWRWDVGELLAEAGVMRTCARRGAA